MDKLSLWSIIFVSFPEELLIVVTTMAIAGFKDILNFKHKGNILKLTFATLLLVIITTFLRSILPSIALNSVVIFPLFFIVIILIYRYNPLKCMLGFILSMLVLLVSESTFTSVLIKSFGLSLDNLYENNLLRIIISLPKLIIQAMVAFLILKKKNISFSFNKLSFNQWIQVILLSAVFINSLFSIEMGLKNMEQNSKTIFTLIINILIMLSFVCWTIINAFKVEKKSLINSKIHNFELERIKKLLQNGQVNQVLDLIDLTIKQTKEGK